MKVRTIGDSSDDGARGIWNSIPTMTRTLLILCLVTNSLGRLGILPWSWIFYNGWLILGMQWWRVVTASIVVSGQPLNALMEVYNLLTRSRDLEVGHFDGSTPEYAFYLTFVLASNAVIGSLIMGLSAWIPLATCFNAALVCSWSLIHRRETVMFYNVVPLQAQYYVPLHLAMELIFQGHTHMLYALIGCVSSYAFTCYETRTKGPAWGWLKSFGPHYGFVRVRGAPQWFCAVYEAAASASVPQIKRGGQRLGSAPRTRSTITENTKRGKSAVAQSARSKNE